MSAISSDRWEHPDSGSFLTPPVRARVNEDLLAEMYRAEDGVGPSVDRRRVDSATRLAFRYGYRCPRTVPVYGAVALGFRDGEAATATL
ncbi:hypothetical protein PBI_MALAGASYROSE_72 [Mycobacterium phage MalagasyRose]|uniref:Uncharacterized protein n=1 Tax=Mycobacterium phage MalagasyRose TaxID=2599870 RepID=A0A5J6TDN2_9CAUD|nr:hypothetical protein QEH39_gp16 [Mycobacterium phage MalagasyRose]QFG08920.1 hypothetical protein PBI_MALAGASYROSE_72 [Mycobacterium phage MalagasyRose]